jgi:hypothetical protein
MVIYLQTRISCPGLFWSCSEFDDTFMEYGLDLEHLLGAWRTKPP